MTCLLGASGADVLGVANFISQDGVQGAPALRPGKPLYPVCGRGGTVQRWAKPGPGGVTEMLSRGPNEREITPLPGFAISPP